MEGNRKEDRKKARSREREGKVVCLEFRQTLRSIRESRKVFSEVKSNKHSLIGAE